MTITIAGRAIRGTGTIHTARCYGAGWVVSWLPGRLLTRDEAITAMKIAVTARRARCAPGPHEWAAELGLPGPRARRMAS